MSVRECRAIPRNSLLTAVIMTIMRLLNFQRLIGSTRISDTACTFSRVDASPTWGSFNHACQASRIPLLCMSPYFRLSECLPRSRFRVGSGLLFACQLAPGFPFPCRAPAFPFACLAERARHGLYSIVVDPIDRRRRLWLVLPLPDASGATWCKIT